MAGELRIGTSGYQYRPWRGDFYPNEIPLSRWFEFYAGQFDTVEINNTFYGLPSDGTFEAWRERAPDGFLYALKYSRYATHMKRLLDPADPLSLFLGRAERLRDHLGPILVQLPPKWTVDVDRLAGFLKAAPKSYRWTVEVRDRSWLREDVYRLLRDEGAALCIHDLVENHPWEITADWTYLRFHGGREYNQPYGVERLESTAGRIEALIRQGIGVYVYFNNDIGGHAYRDARTLRAMLADNAEARAA